MLTKIMAVNGFEIFHMDTSTVSHRQADIIMVDGKIASFHQYMNGCYENYVILLSISDIIT